MSEFSHVGKHVRRGTAASVVQEQGKVLLGFICDHVGHALRKPGSVLSAQATISARGAPIDLIMEVRLRAATPEDLAAMDAVHARRGGADV